MLAGLVPNILVMVELLLAGLVNTIQVANSIATLIASKYFIGATHSFRHYA